ncbi:MAG: hypothetical protein K2N93_05620 [Alistipes sp.]|nr:hypothetical protein [Alistipes sp.]
MKYPANPFRYIAGGRALAAGLALIAVASCWLRALGLLQNSYLHFGPAPEGFALWRTAALQAGMWLAPALLLYGCGRMLSPSRIRLVDVLGTTALAQAPILLLLLPLSIGPLRAFLDRTTAELLAGTLPTPGQTAALAAWGIWSLAALALFYVRNYQAYALSCNLRGGRAVGSYIAVAVLMTLLTQYLPL